MAVFTAHSYLHCELPDMPFLVYSRPASSAPSRHKQNVPDKVDRQFDRAILTLELKQPGVLKSCADEPAPSLSGVWNSRIANEGERVAHVTPEDSLVDSVTSSKLASLICQLWEYMCRWGSIYGWSFVQWPASLPGQAGGLPPDEPVYSSIPFKDDDDDEEQPKKSPTATDSDESYHPHKSSRKRKRGKPASSLGVTGRLARHVTLRDVPEESLHIEKVIAQGASGNIAEGRIDDTRVAISLRPSHLLMARCL
ncbi:g2280 [Coccomyxa elongata]